MKPDGEFDGRAASRFSGVGSNYTVSVLPGDISVVETDVSIRCDFGLICAAARNC